MPQQKTDEELLDLIDEWHDGKHQGRTLPEVMDMTDSEYAAWVQRTPYGTKPDYIEISLGQQRGRVYRWPVRYGTGGN